MDSNTPSVAGVSRARTACLVCRSRKVRCDRTLPACQNCIRLGVSCPGFSEGQQAISRKQMLKSTEDIFKAAGKERRRIGSCEQCRTTKNYCSREKPSCKRCTSRGLACTYRAKSDKGSPHEPLDMEAQVDRSQKTLSNRTIVVPALEIDYQQLCSEILPEDTALRVHLINAYFERIHPLRYLSFIHKPSFMHAIDRASLTQDYIEPLIYVICALGAKVLYTDSLWSGVLEHAPGSAVPGEAWAEKARRDVLVEAHAPTLQHLMAMVLLCEYGIRTDRNAQVFVLSGCLFRSLRLLGFDMPQQPTTVSESPSEILQQETENRVVWACYHVDLMLASGVDKNSLWHDDVPLIPLPSSNESFLSLTPSRTLYLTEVETLENMSMARQLDLPTLIIILMRLRSVVLRLIRTAPPSESLIWDQSSSFMVLIQRLESFYDNLPEKFKITSLNLYMHKDQNLIGAVLFLHLVYHAAVFDLTRITLPGFTFPLSSALQGAAADFRFKYQQICRYHSNEVSNLFKEAFIHGSTALDQPFCADIALESSKIQIVYAATVDNSTGSVEIARQNVKTNLQLLKLLHTGKEGQSLYIRAILPLCRLFGFADISQEWSERQSPFDNAAEVTGPADIHHLSNMAFFRQARSEARAGQAGSTRGTQSSSGLDGSPNTIAKENELQQLPGRNSAMTMPMGAEATNQGLYSRHSNLPVLPHIANLAGDRHQHDFDNAGNMELTASTTHDHDPEILNLQPSIEDYIRTADGINNYLTYHMSEISELPPWITFDLPDNPG